MTRAHHAATVVEPDRSLHVTGLPFEPGRRVEVTIREVTGDQVPTAEAGAWRKLRGTVLRYDDPTLPVGVEDWESLK